MDLVISMLIGQDQKFNVGWKTKFIEFFQRPIPSPSKQKMINVESNWSCWLNKIYVHIRQKYIL
jgi:hypothetical protein